MSTIQQMLLGYGAAGADLITEVIPFTITIAASATSNTATISSVDTSLSTVIFGGHTGSSTDAYDADHDFPAVVLTDSTTVTAIRQVADANTITVKGTVVVWNTDAIESIQTGIVTFTGASGTQAISSVTTANSALIYNGFRTTYTAAVPYNIFVNMAITSTTQVTGYRGTGSGTAYGYFTIIEFKSGVLESNTQAVSINVSGTSSTATISSVDTTKTWLCYGGMFSKSGGVGIGFNPYISLTNGTTVTGLRNSSSATVPNVKGTVIEFKSADIASVNRQITIVGASSTTGTTTISSIDTTKAFVQYLGETSTTTSYEVDEDSSHISITDSTTLTAERYLAAAQQPRVSNECIEFT